MIPQKKYKLQYFDHFFEVLTLSPKKYLSGKIAKKQVILLYIAEFMN